MSNLSKFILGFCFLMVLVMPHVASQDTSIFEQIIFQIMVIILGIWGAYEYRNDKFNE